MKILVSGAGGLIGSALLPSLLNDGHAVGRLVRSGPDSDPASPRIYWDPQKNVIDEASMKGFEAVVHLAGENIAASHWDEETRRRIRDSRVHGTRLLSQTLTRLSPPPKVLVCASATGYYGSRGAEILTEDCPAGTGFLPEVCREWEAAADPAREKGIRVVHARFGMVLCSRGGALTKMLTPFKLGLGGRIGRGDQFMSWVAIDDAVRAIRFLLDSDALSGAVNAVSPNPVQNAEFTRALGRVLFRPTIAVLPAFAARMLFGPMADELLLASCRAIPRRLLDARFTFQLPEIEPALRHSIRGSH